MITTPDGYDTFTPRDQEILTDDGQNRPGDCLRAALATIYGLTPLLVPHFAEFDDWHAGMETWRKGLSYLEVLVGDDWLRLARLASSLEHHLFVGIGASPRSGKHAVVYTTVTGEMVHDPHPSRLGIVGAPESVVVRCW